VLRELTTNQKGALAESAIAKAACALGIEVYGPLFEDGRYDMIFALDRNLIRVQCKWAPLYRDCVIIRCCSTRRARLGCVRRPYTAEEIDAFAAYCEALDRCFFVPIEVVGSSPQISLRVSPTRNNQRLRVRNASDFDFGARLNELIPGP
jgi:hypothetical protein